MWRIQIHRLYSFFFYIVDVPLLRKNVLELKFQWTLTYLPPSLAVKLSQSWYLPKDHPFMTLGFGTQKKSFFIFCMKLLVTCLVLSYGITVVSWLTMWWGNVGWRSVCSCCGRDWWWVYITSSGMCVHMYCKFSGTAWHWILKFAILDWFYVVYDKGSWTLVYDIVYDEILFSACLYFSMSHGC